MLHVGFITANTFPHYVETAIMISWAQLSTLLRLTTYCWRIKPLFIILQEIKKRGEKKSSKKDSNSFFPRLLRLNKKNWWKYRLPQLCRNLANILIFFPCRISFFVKWQWIKVFLAIDRWVLTKIFGRRKSDLESLLALLEERKWVDQFPDKLV